MYSGRGMGPFALIVRRNKWNGGTFICVARRRARGVGEEGEGVFVVAIGRVFLRKKVTGV